MIELYLKFDYENTAFSRTHYTTEYKGIKRNIVIIHEKSFDEICTATKDGEPCSDLKEDIIIYLNEKKFITKKRNGYTILKAFSLIDFMDSYKIAINEDIK